MNNVTMKFCTALRAALPNLTSSHDAERVDTSCYAESVTSFHKDSSLSKARPRRHNYPGKMVDGGYYDLSGVSGTARACRRR